MRLSTVFELLLIFLLIAFAAYGRVIDRDEVTSLRRVIRATEGRAKQGNLGVSILSLNQATENLNKYCTCDRDVCQCCRDFHIPVVSLKGPGCASIRYFEKDNLELQLSFGDNLLTNTVVNGKKPRTICVPMPGGYSKFCGRIYSVERESDDNFKACLGLELQSSYEVEASLRLSCFSFGPDGLKLRPAEAFPPTVLNENDDDDDDDDDDDELGSFFDFSDDSDNKKDINQLPSKNTAVAGSNQQSDDDEDDNDEEDDDDDYLLGIDAFLDIITDDDETEKKKPTTASPLLLTVPTINKPTTAKPIVSRTTTKAPKLEAETSTVAVSPETLGLISETESSTEISLKNATEPSAEEEPTTESSATELALEISSSTSETTDENKTEQPLEAAGSNDNKQVVKVKKVPVIKKIIVGVTDKKTSITSNSANAIKNDVKKPLVKPAKPDPLPKPNDNVDDNGEEDDDLLSAAVDDDDDDEDDDDDDDEEEEEEEEETENVEDHEENDDVKHEETTSAEGNDKRPDHDNDHEEVSEEDLLDDDDGVDDDEEEETSLMSALIDDNNDDDNKKNKNGGTSTEASKKDNEYENIDDFFGRKMPARRGRQSKVMRL